MEFDEQVRHAFDQLAARLHEEITGQVNQAFVKVAASLEADRARAVNDATREAWTVAAREVSERLTASLAAAEARARTGFETEEIAAGERLVAAIRSLDRGQSLSEILDVLALSASVETRRAAIFLPEGSQFRGWRFVGFDQILGDTAEVLLSFDEGGLIADAADTGIVVRAGEPAWSGSSLSLVPAFAALPPERPALAVPLVMSGQVFGVLYVDQGPSGDITRESWPATVEVLARHAARSLEAITVGRLAQLSESRT